MNGSQVALKAMKKQGHGFIYNMEGFGSDGRVMSKMSIYGTSKQAITYFTKALAKECEGTPVKVGRLSPGMVVTDFMMASMPEDRVEALKMQNVYNLFGDRVEDVTAFLVEGMLKNTKNNANINWLTNTKVLQRVITRRNKRINFFK